VYNREARIKTMIIYNNDNKKGYIGFVFLHCTNIVMYYLYIIIGV